MRKKTQIDINLDRVQDEGAREALRGLLEFVNGLVGKGLETDANVKAREFGNHNKEFFVDADGQVTARAFRTYGSFGRQGAEKEVPGYMKFSIREGVLEDSDTIDLKIEGKVLGVVGWTQFNGHASQMVPMRINSGAAPATQNYFGVTTDSLTDTVHVVNSDAVNDNRYRVLIFYAKD
jgi:hypothetical protein